MGINISAASIFTTDEVKLEAEGWYTGIYQPAWHVM
jgi:hypothetical protein